jgi:hypothetical protein
MARTKQESETSLQRHREEPQKLAQPEPHYLVADGSKASRIAKLAGGRLVTVRDSGGEILFTNQ